MRRIRGAFTLIELLTVIAITAVLMTLIVLPMVQSFTLTRQAQAFSDAQDRARRLGEQIAREIGTSAGVRDNSGMRGVIAVDPLYDVKTTTLDASNETTTTVFLPYSKLDLAKPAQGEPPSTPGAGFTDPFSGKIDPTLKAPKGQVTLPVAPGGTIVRYWIGLRDPFSDYTNPYNSILLAAGSGRDNLYVLWRAEVQPMVYNTTLNRFVVNKALFYDLSRVKNPPLTPTPGKHELPSAYRYSATSTGVAYDYPSFFDPNDMTYTYDSGKPDPSGSADPSQAQMVQNWMDHANIVTDLNRSDMIQPVYDRLTQKVLFDGAAPRLLPLVQFKPTRISNDPATGQVAVRQGEEADSAAYIGPDVYRTQYGEWSNAVVRTYPDTWTTQGDTYEIARDVHDPTTNALLGRSIFAVPTGADEFSDSPGVLSLLFNMTTYDSMAANALSAQYPFTASTNFSNAQTYAGQFDPFFMDSTGGRLLASFGINEVGTGAPANGDVANRPFGLVTEAISPLMADPNTNTPVWSPLDPSASPNDPSNTNCYDINRCFNRAWSDPIGITLRPDIQRFIDLRVMPQADGSQGPLPLNLDPGDANAKYHFSRAQIVPGSEQVFGPDQRPGANYGNQVQYSRVTQNPGPDQYRINYVDQDQATPVDYTLLGFSGPPPAVYDPTNFESAVIEPRYKVGYLQLNSDPALPLPVGSFTVFYRFQFSHPKDVFAVDYDSREVMSVLLTVKNFPQQGLSNAQNVTIPVTAKVRNFIR